MILPDLTAKTPLGAVDLVPFLRRDAGALGVAMREWERAPAALALARMGWHPERIGHAVGLSSGRVHELLGDHEVRRTERHRKAAARAEHTATWRQAQARRFAGRVEVGGRLIHPLAPRHGHHSIYTSWGCRCVPCSRAHSEHNSAYRRKTA